MFPTVASTLKPPRDASRAPSLWAVSRGSFYDGYREFQTMYECHGSSKHHTQLTGLVPENTYTVRMAGRNDDGLSVWSEPIEFVTPSTESDGPEEDLPIPKKWLQVAMSHGRHARSHASNSRVTVT